MDKKTGPQQGHLQPMTDYDHQGLVDQLVYEIGRVYDLREERKETARDYADKIKAGETNVSDLRQQLIIQKAARGAAAQ